MGVHRVYPWQVPVATSGFVARSERPRGGIGDIKNGVPGGAIRPVVPFGRIEMHIDYPLFTPPDGEDPTAEAD